MVRLQLPPAPPSFRSLGEGGRLLVWLGATDGRSLAAEWSIGVECWINWRHAAALPHLLHHSITHFSLPGRLISRTSPFEGDRDGANPSPAANFDLRA